MTFKRENETNEQFKEREKRLRFVLEAAGLGAWEWIIDSDSFVADDYSQHLIGGLSGGLETFLTKIHPKDRERVKANTEQAIASRQIFSQEFRLFGPDGQIRWIETKARVMCDSAGRPVSIFGVMRDVSEKKNFEAEVYRTQRLESIGALASGIAHDLNNVLAPILMALHTLQQRFTDENSQRWLSLIYKSAQRGRDLIEQMISFAKGASGERTPLQLDQIVGDLSKILRETLPRDIELDVRMADNLWGLTGDVTQIHQVLMNLCINARDAMPQGGRLTILAENITLEENEKSDIGDGRYLHITVADTGSGIPPQIIDRIFDPFFTTKEKGKGSGLGLSTVLGIVRGHAGFVKVQSKLSQGSEFHIYLPARESTLPNAKEPKTLEPLAGHGELILLIDDEPDICEVAKHTLESCGYRVLATFDGQKAIEIFQQYQNEIEVVLTDMMMPNMDGPAVIRELKSLNPDVKVIATSGIRSTGKLSEAVQAGINFFLPKPYTADKLLATLADVLRRRN